MKAKNKRHSIAFVVSTLIYGVAIAFIFGLFTSDTLKRFQTQPSHIEVVLVNEDDTPQKALLKDTENSNRFSPPLIKKDIPSRKIEKIHNPIQNEFKEEKVVEQPKTPLQAKLEENTQNQNQNIKEQNPKKEILKEVEKEEIQPSKIATKIEKKELPPFLNTPIKEKQNLQEFKNKRENYFALLKQTIEKNKYYPKNALRRGIEGDVKVKFTISTDGKLLLIERIEGNSVFHTSIKDAIASSFPIFPPQNILTENTTLDLIVSYKLNYN